MKRARARPAAEVPVDVYRRACDRLDAALERVHAAIDARHDTEDARARQRAGHVRAHLALLIRNDTRRWRVAFHNCRLRWPDAFPNP